MLAAVHDARCTMVAGCCATLQQQYFPKDTRYTPTRAASHPPREIRIELLMLSNTQRRAVIGKR